MFAWHAAGPGIMHWQPSVSEKDMQDCITEYEHEQNDLVLPSIEEVFDYHVKIESRQHPNSTIANSPSTCASELTRNLSDALASLPTPIILGPDIFEQLKSFAPSPAAEDVKIGADVPALSPISHDPESDTQCESDHTEFHLTRQSPCKRKANLSRTKPIAKPEVRVKKAKEIMQYDPVVRRLFSRKTATKKIPQETKRSSCAKLKSKSAAVQSLQDLRALESDPHTWTEEEKCILLVLMRWYDVEEATSSGLYNHMTSLTLKKRTIATQFDYLRRYGPEASLEWAAVFEIPFNDPEGKFAEVRARIEFAAYTLGIQLDMRQQEKDFNAGSGSTAKSPNTRHLWKQRVRLVAQEKAARASKTTRMHRLPVQRMPLGGIVLVADRFDDSVDVFTDVEDTPVPRAEIASVTLESATELPRLVFRVWDDSSRFCAQFDGAFTACGFVDAPDPLPAPMPPDDIYGMWKHIAARHLSQRGGLPFSISTTQSLLQALCYARKGMKNAHIAVIDLTSLSNESNKVHHAADVFRWLKSQGLAKWARYKGEGEYICWARIPGDCIMHVFDVDELWQLAADDPASTSLLRPRAFGSGLKTLAVASHLRNTSCVLNTSIAGAMGRVAKLFGMRTLTDQHLTDFIARLVDGFYVEQNASTDIHTMSTIASHFALAFGSHPLYTHQQLMSAFLDGIDQGLRYTERWSSSGSGQKKANPV